MSDRLPQRRLDALVNHVDGVFVNNTTTVALARENPTRIYKCPACKGWHTTSQEKCFQAKPSPTNT